MVNSILRLVKPNLIQFNIDRSSIYFVALMFVTICLLFQCFPDRYDDSLYRAHVECIYSGLIVHMDDPSTDIQLAVLGMKGSLPYDYSNA